MNSLIFRTATRLILPVLLLFSLFMLLRGHNEPGGGFIGGLVAAAAMLLYLLAEGPAQLRRTFPSVFRRLLPLGLLLAIAAGLLSLLRGQPFLTGIWVTISLPGIDSFKVGTPLLFDIGVFMVVVGMTVEVILRMAEEETWKLF